VHAAQPCPVARLRGTAAGLLTAALTVAAHGVASGAPPSGAAAAQLAVLATAIGALAATVARAADARVLLGLLAAGQLVGHTMLTAVGHTHTPAMAMVIAHVVAVVAGAALIAAGDRLCGVLSRAVRVAVRAVAPPPEDSAVVAVRHADQPLRFTLLLAASVSHRGPPVSHAR
jgi:hypothetical protein